MTGLLNWKEDLTQMTEASQLPKALNAYIDFLEKELETPIKIVSVGEAFKLESVYFIIYNDNPNQVGFYVIENDKIVSFFPEIYIKGRDKKETPKIPFMLNNK